MSDIEPICRKCGKSIPDGSWAGVKMARRGFEYEHLQCPSPCPNCEAAAREVADLKSDKAWAGKLSAENADELSNLRREHDDLRARLDKLADRWDTESVAEYKQCASELEALLAETEAK